MASISQLFDWPTANKALRAGWRVRRNGWTDRWLVRWTGGLIWLILNDGTKRVVENTDFGVEEFAALDWTNLPPECVTAGTTPGTGTNGCPLPYSASPASTSATAPQSSQPQPVPLDPTLPPTVGAGGGGGGGGGGSTPQRDPETKTWPTISLALTDTTEGTCYVDDGTNPYVTVLATASLSGDSSLGFFFVSIYCGGSCLPRHWPD